MRAHPALQHGSPPAAPARAAMVGAAPGGRGGAAAGPGAAGPGGQGPGAGRGPGAGAVPGGGGVLRGPSPRPPAAGARGWRRGGGGRLPPASGTGATPGARGLRRAGGPGTGAAAAARRVRPERGRQRGARPGGGGAEGSPGCGRCSLPLAGATTRTPAVLRPGALGGEARGGLAADGKWLLRWPGAVRQRTAGGSPVSASRHLCERWSKQPAVRGGRAERPLGPGSAGQGLRGRRSLHLRSPRES